MHRAFVSDLTEKMTLDAQTLHRFKKVLRLEAGSPVELFDGQGKVGRGLLTTGSELEQLRIQEYPKPKQHFILCQAWVSMDKLEQITQHATELGMSELILFRASRSQVDLSKKQTSRQDRLIRIAQDASRQCGRVWVPEIRFSDAILEGTGWGQKLVADPEALYGFGVLESRVSIVIGPEGGFSNEELQKFKTLGAIPVRLSEYVLRTETAGLAALAQLTSVSLCMG